MNTATLERFTRNGHRFYIVDGQEYPSVTTVLSVIRLDESITRWRGHVGNEAADQTLYAAGNLGTLVHAFSDSILANRNKVEVDGKVLYTTSNPPDHIGPMIERFQVWKKLRVEKVIATSQRVVSKRYRFAGELDTVLKLYGESVTLMDFKTGSGVGMVDLQLTHYQMAREEMTGEIIDRLGVLRLDKVNQGKLAVKYYTSHKQEVVAARVLYRHFYKK